MINDVKEKALKEYSDSQNENEEDLWEPDLNNEEEYADKPMDYNYTPSFETEQASMVPIINFFLKYSGDIDTV